MVKFLKVSAAITNSEPIVCVKLAPQTFSSIYYYQEIMMRELALFKPPHFP